MNASVDETLRRWLSAESQIAESQIAENEIIASQITRSRMKGADQEVVARQALSELMRALPEVRPRPGFADRVMAASGLEERLAHTGFRHLQTVTQWLFDTREDVQGKPFQALAGVVMLLVGSAVAGLPSVAVWLSGVVSLTDIVSASAHFFTLAAGFLATLMTVSSVLLALYDALLLVLISPPVMLASLGAFVLTMFTLRWLTQLLSSTPPHSALSQRSDGYVPAH